MIILGNTLIKKELIILHINNWIDVEKDWETGENKFLKIDLYLDKTKILMNKITVNQLLKINDKITLNKATQQVFDTIDQSKVNFNILKEIRDRINSSQDTNFLELKEIIEKHYFKIQIVLQNCAG